MEMIKVILVQTRAEGAELALVPGPCGLLEIALEVDAETVLEAVRDYFRNRWNAKVHALRWLYPEDFLSPRAREQAPYLVVYAESLGTVPVVPIHVRNERASADGADDMFGLARIAAETLCYAEPWSLPDWLPNVLNWIEGHFHEIQRISQVRVCPNGAVIRTECGDGTYYLKTQLAPLAYEWELLKFLNSYAAGSCPRVLEIRPDCNTHVTEAIRGCPLDKSRDSLTGWLAALRDVATIQMESMSFVEELCNRGVPCNRLASLQSQLEEILERVIGLQDGSPNQLTPLERANISQLARKAAPDFERIARCHIPEALIHGDLNQSNAFRPETGRTVLIDWSLSRVTHPFFTLGSTLFAPFDGKGEKPSGYEELCSAYLDMWDDFAPQKRLRVALDAASRLFWIDSTLAVSSLCQPGHVRNFINLPRFLRATLAAYDLLA